MILGADLSQLLSTYGIFALVPLTVVEGPIATVVAAYLAKLSLLDPVAVFFCAMLGDAIGDALLYACGRYLRPGRWPVVGRRLRIPRRTLVPLVRAIRRHGVKLLVVGKLTQGAGYAALAAAGAARLNFSLFMITNVVAGLPKVLLFMAIGYAFGSAQERVGNWIFFGSLILCLPVLVAGVLYFRARRKDHYERPHPDLPHPSVQRSASPRTGSGGGPGVLLGRSRCGDR
jgi:membrane-associated protein